MRKLFRFELIKLWFLTEDVFRCFLVTPGLEVYFFTSLACSNVKTTHSWKICTGSSSPVGFHSQCSPLFQTKYYIVSCLRLFKVVYLLIGSLHFTYCMPSWLFEGSKLFFLVTKLEESSMKSMPPCHLSEASQLVCFLLTLLSRVKLSRHHKNRL